MQKSQTENIPSAVRSVPHVDKQKKRLTVLAGVVYMPLDADITPMLQQLIDVCRDRAVAKESSDAAARLQIDVDEGASEDDDGGEQKKKDEVSYPQPSV